MYTRMKRVTDPLDDKVKARIVGRPDKTEPDYVTSGSEHSSQSNHDVTSEFFFDFGVDDDLDSSPESKNGSDSDSDRDSSMYDSSCVNVDSIHRALQDRTDEFQKMLKIHVSRAVQVFTCAKSDREMMRRNVMSFLRNYGYNAAVCKAKWRSSGGLTAGSHEFIDVLRSEQSTRYFVDLDFAAEFEIARPTNSYDRLFQCLPRVFVGKSDDLRLILKAMSDAAKRSLKSGGLILPPWRKHRFMQNKWFGSFRRTTNLFPATFTAAKQSNGVQCRAVGFDAAVNGGCLLFAATARTR
ncbi:hypothetical protein BUALT_Bualt02G0001800 [Buddleja alternifolia]|uniref:DUF506 family protein n=1 Tax=Buddleja alternifolia TaxID=168488 RepID=A0AAV6XXM3_9LAMI|nr:hypothetical protein BUALT_Bualt02G0001800 [Buddleja alternifolia]